MSKIQHLTLYLIIILNLAYSVFWIFKNINLNIKYNIGEEIDSYNDVKVYHNGGVNNVSGRNISDKGYNIGLKYQCVEFVKRYYLQYLKY